MSSAKSEAGDLAPKSNLQGASVQAEAEALGSVSAIPVAGNRGSSDSGAVHGAAFFDGAVFDAATFDGGVIPNKILSASSGSFELSGAPAEMTVIRQPFSLVSIAEQLENDPDYHQRLAEFVAAELARASQKFSGRGNAEQVIKAELHRLERGFSEIAEHVATKAYEKAAEVVVSLRDGLVAFHEHHTQLVDNLFSLSAVSLSTYVLGRLGVPVILGVLISASVVKNEKLADLFKAWKDK